MKTVVEYIENQPEAVRPILEKLRALIFQIAPEAQEEIAYAMPAYKLHGKPLVYFAAQTKHLGFYATPSGHEKFTSRLAEYKHGKGSVQFPFTRPIPFDLIEDIVRFRVLEEK